MLGKFHSIPASIKNDPDEILSQVIFNSHGALARGPEPLQVLPGFSPKIQWIKINK